MTVIDIEKCLYFGITQYRGFDPNCVEKSLKSILISRLIMTRNSLKKKHILSDGEFSDLEKEKTCCQGNNSVSIACHPANTTVWEKHNCGRILSPRSEDAYSSYICGHNPALILNSSILNDLDFNTMSSSNRMLYELQVIGDIPIKYVLAVGLLDNLTIDINNLIKFPNGKEISPRLFVRTSHGLEKYIKQGMSEEEIVFLYYRNILKFESIVKEINPELPIVNKKTGFEIPSFDKQMEKIRELKRILS